MGRGYKDAQWVNMMEYSGLWKSQDQGDGAAPILGTQKLLPPVLQNKCSILLIMQQQQILMGFPYSIGDGENISPKNCWAKAGDQARIEHRYCGITLLLSGF